MRAELTIRTADGQLQHHVVLDVPDDSTGTQLAELLASQAPTQGVLHLGDTPLTSFASIDEMGALDGAVLTVGGPGPKRPRIRGARLHVQDGPDAGVVYPVTTDARLVGRGTDCALSIADGALSRSGNFSIRYEDGFVLDAREATNGILLDGVPTVGEARVTAGQRWLAGQSIFSVVATDPPELATRPGPGGSVLMTRQFRTIAEPKASSIQWPGSAPQEEQNRFPWLQVFGPLALGLVMIVIAVVSGNLMFAAFGAMGPVMSLVTVLTDRRRRGREMTDESTRYQAARANAETALKAATKAELTALLQRNPSLPELVEAAVAPSARLWERRPRDDDFLEVRLGTGDLPTRGITVQGADGQAVPTMKQAPVALRLGELGCIGIFGPDASVRGVARSLVTQLATLHGPDDLRLVCLLRDAAHGDWEWLRWLPHARRDDGSALVGNSDETTQALITELAALVDQRVAAREAVRRGGPAGGAVVVVVEDASELRDNPRMAKILSHGPEVGVFLICCEPRRAQLPQECRAAVEVPNDGVTDVARVEIQGAAAIHPVNLDLLAPAVAELVARSLTPMRIAGTASENESSGLPATVRLLDITGTRGASAADLKRRWDLGGRTTKVVVGQSADGPFVLDISEHGPHGVVAGTSGAGKSQLLMSLVTGLALENTPEDLSFVLVDFKGGGAFEACANLPHTASMVTNLSGGEARRAITALRAESLHRQQLFAPFGADIENYDQARRAGDPRAAQNVPRLVIIVDEFAQLAEEYDDLMTEFVNIARVGRSLGMHMILATQRPSGIISPQIRSNCDLRIALRVTDPADSNDVIDRPDAAEIAKTSRGRAFIRAADEIREVQTAAVGLPLPGTGHAVGAWAQPRPWVQAGQPVVAPQATIVQADDPTQTDLFWAVELVKEAAALGSYQLPPSPVLPPLAEETSIDDLAPPRPGGAPIGLEDLPEQQLQRTASYHPGDGHLLIPGGQRSGRTTTLRSLAASVAKTWSSADAHLYILDFGGGGLRSLDQLPHVGAVVGQEQPQRARRLIQRLSEEVRRRMSVFEEQGVGNIEEQRARAGATPLPYLVLLVDRWDVLVDREGGSGELSHAIGRLISEGASFGVSVVLTSDNRRGRQLAGEIADVLCLPFNEAMQYNDFGIPGRDIGIGLPPGRAIRGNSTTAVQIGYLGDDPSGAAQNDCVALLAAELTAREASVPDDRAPFRVDELPGRITTAQLDRFGPLDGAVLPLAVGGDRLHALCWDPRTDPVLVITGSSGGGRSTTLRTLAAVAGDRRVLAANTDAIPGAESITLDETTAKSVLESGVPTLVLVDDGDMLSDDSGLALLLDNPAPHVALAVVSAPDPLRLAMRGVALTLSRIKTGLLLLPQGSAHRDIFGLRNLGPGDVIDEPKGRGYWVENGQPTLAQAVMPA